MTSRNQSSVAALKTSLAECACKKATSMTSILSTIFAVLALGTISMAAELPEAPSSVISSDAPMIEATAFAPRIVALNPEVKLIDKTFVSLAVASTGSTFADSYTTLFARQNWMAHKQGVCNEEVQSPYLYGTHPTVGRAYAVASARSAGSIFAAYYLRKHHSRFWSLPLFATSVISLQGVTQNMMACN
jgi:hypothetical protein